MATKAAGTYSGNSCSETASPPDLPPDWPGSAGDVQLTAHFHNTRGQGLANAYAALQAGCTSFESSVGELGGCPVPKGSTGKIATEDPQRSPASAPGS